jgi:hypothetical protein
MLHWVSDTVHYFREARAFLRDTITPEEARRIIAEQYARREQAFIELMRAVYADSRNPYHRLLTWAGVDFEELKRLVGENGLEGALERLLDRGVYVTQDEFKGRVPVRRPGLEFRAKPADFDNPLANEGLLESSSSGSTGAPVRVGVPLDRVGFRAAETLLLENGGALGRPLAPWKDGSVRSLLRYAKVGLQPERQFTSVGFRWNREGLRYLVLVNATLLATRLAGFPLPRPEVVPVNEAARVVRWLARKSAAGAPAVMPCPMSRAVRICAVAEELGLDLTGTLFLIGGEPFTPAKARTLAKVGATATVRYSMSETSMIGVSCETPYEAGEVDDMHLMEAKVALIHQEHQTPAGETVRALIYTNVLPGNPKMLLNLYSGDCAEVSERECGCFLGQIGMKTHISRVRSYEKLTGEAVTFVVSQLYDLVEDVLPRRFGGHVQDYQLVEEEMANGLPRLSIVISERVGPVNEAAVIKTVMENLQATHNHTGGELMSEIWRQGDTLRVVRREPDERASKIAPLRLRPRVSEPAAEVGSAAVG